MSEVGKDLQRKEALQKVTGEAKYTDDYPYVDFLHARIAVSPYPHARIISIDVREALSVKGVKLVLTGSDCSALWGPLLQDRPLLARDFVRYAGEPVALVAALDEAAASLAVEKIHVNYEILPAVFEPFQAFNSSDVLLHKNSETYIRTVDDVFPKSEKNTSAYYPVKKGNMTGGWEKSEITVSKEFNLSPSGHIAMEVRTARARVLHDGAVEIITASQSPYEVVRQIADGFNIPSGNIRVRVPFVGGAFGGKASVMLEPLAYLASVKLNGRPVRLVITREQDMETLPCRIGLWAKIKLGADRNGLLQAAELTFLIDNGAYADIGPYMAKAIAADCTGPYNIENLNCDVYSVYTNHTFSTSYRGFAHESVTFCVERTMDIIADNLKVDPLELRKINAIRPGNLTPSKVKSTLSNTGNLEACINELKSISGGKEPFIQIDDNIVRATGYSCFWKSPNPPPDAVSGAIVTVNSDGTFNLAAGVIEMGNGSKSLLAQMFAERLGIATDMVHVDFAVDTRLNPEHYKTVASFTSYIAGRAVMRAADDVLHQIRKNVSMAFKCAYEDIEVGGGRAYLRHNPDCFLLFKDILSGYSSDSGETVGDPVIGRGGFMLKGLSNLNPQTGEGRNAPAWTVGAQAVEVEVDKREYSYRILNAYTVIDVGKVINPAEQRGMIKGGMAMGLSMASRESFKYDKNGRISTPTLRTYKLFHFGEQPKYHVSFVETKQEDSPFGTRPMSEHGIIGMPAALANALSAAAGISADILPITPENLWNNRGGKNDRK